MTLEELQRKADEAGKLERLVYMLFGLLHKDTEIAENMRDYWKHLNARAE